MNIINTVSVKRFSLNGVPYFKNYISSVVGDRVTVFNCYDRRDVLIPLTHYSEFSVDTVEFDNAIDLQTELIDVLYARLLGSDFAEQNNIGKYYSIGLTPGGPVNATEAKNVLNEYTYIISQINTPVFFNFTRETEVGYYNYVFVFLGGKGTWGSGGTPFTTNNLRLIAVRATTTDDVEDGEGIVIIQLGELEEDGFLDAANAETHDFLDPDVQYYFSYTVDDELILKLFIGEPGLYGDGETPFTEEMFATIPQDAGSPVPSYQDTLQTNPQSTIPALHIDTEAPTKKTGWHQKVTVYYDSGEPGETFEKVISLEEMSVGILITEANVIQHERLKWIPLNSLPIPFEIRADNQSWQDFSDAETFPDIDYDPATGTITGFPVGVGKAVFVTPIII